MSDKPLTGLEKAAVLLKSLSPTIVEKVLTHMGPKEAKLLTAELAKIAQRPDLKEMVSRVLDEAVNVLADVASKDANEADGVADPVAAIAALSPDLLTKALDSESARTISLLMNRMD